MTISPKKILTLIPARGGSKGILRKNVQLLGQAPLVAWSIKAAQATPLLKDIYLSTNDEDIARAGRAAGAEILRRPDRLSQDASTVVSMVDHHLAEFNSRGIGYDYVIYLEPTSPFRTSEEITNCLQKMVAGGYDSVATFAPTLHHPENLLSMGKEGQLSPYDGGKLAVQSGQKTYALSGAVYAFDIKAFQAQRPGGIFFGRKGHIIQTSPAIDIDYPIDLMAARACLPYLDNSFFKDIGLV